MGEQAAEASFAIEAADELARMSEVVGEDFDGDRATARHVVAEKNGTHSAFPDATEKTISGDFTQTRVRVGRYPTVRNPASRAPSLRPDSPRESAGYPTAGLPVHPCRKTIP